MYIYHVNCCDRRSGNRSSLRGSDILSRTTGLDGLLQLRTIKGNVRVFYNPNPRGPVEPVSSLASVDVVPALEEYLM